MDTPPFSEAVAAFHRFVDDQGFSTHLAWVFREDVTNRYGRYWIRESALTANIALAEKYFEYGRKQGLGVTLEVLARLDGRSACFVRVPKDQIDAEYSMQGPLKLSVPVNLKEAIPVRSAWVWHFRTWVNWRSRFTFFDERLPLRKEVIRLIEAG